MSLNTTGTIASTTPATALPGTEPQHALTAADRCDQCQARAYVSFTTSSGTVLLLCGHHYGRHEQAIADLGYEVRDERDQLRQALPNPNGTAPAHAPSRKQAPNPTIEN
ncbi:hypothetical protein GCG21_08660 [Pseudactinotalea sp. HY160]|uniref:DUF7455 domain-containing protein n=1 Tax=Pseudactinotalea sp. HY160 TaxID=2654490 RepID=UPI00128B813E|nr:hypothetical protein [Pseudactinotalea sp. HY160]MPV50075.1 hypothetical protein [Pseudactinotalea sp. HY160]